MRIVSGTLARALRPGEGSAFLIGHERSYLLEAPYLGAEWPAGRTISMTLINIPAPDSQEHSLLQFDVEQVVRISA